MRYIDVRLFPRTGNGLAKPVSVAQLSPLPAFERSSYHIRDIAFATTRTSGIDILHKSRIIDPLDCFAEFTHAKWGTEIRPNARTTARTRSGSQSLLNIAQCTESAYGKDLQLARGLDRQHISDLAQSSRIKEAFTWRCRLSLPNTIFEHIKTTSTLSPFDLTLPLKTP